MQANFIKKMPNILEAEDPKGTVQAASPPFLCCLRADCNSDHLSKQECVRDTGWIQSQDQINPFKRMVSLTINSNFFPGCAQTYPWAPGSHSAPHHLSKTLIIA